MGAEQNRRRMEAAFEGLARGDSRAFGALMGEDFNWTVPGDTPWSRTFHGRDECVRDLFRPLYAQFAEPQLIDALSFTAEGDRVVVESRSRPAKLVSGRTYWNEYCYVCRFEGDRLVSIREYLDTARLAAALDPPPWALPAAAPRA